MVLIGIQGVSVESVGGIRNMVVSRLCGKMALMPRNPSNRIITENERVQVPKFPIGKVGKLVEVTDLIVPEIKMEEKRTATEETTRESEKSIPVKSQIPEFAFDRAWK